MTDLKPAHVRYARAPRELQRRIAATKYRTTADKGSSGSKENRRDDHFGKGPETDESGGRLPIHNLGKNMATSLRPLIVVENRIQENIDRLFAK